MNKDAWRRFLMNYPKLKKLVLLALVDYYAEGNEEGVSAYKIKEEMLPKAIENYPELYDANFPSETPSAQLVTKYVYQLEEDGLVNSIIEGKRKKYIPSRSGIDVIKKFKDEILHGFEEKLVRNIVWDVKIGNLDHSFPKNVRENFFYFNLSFKCERIIRKDNLNFLCTMNENKFKEFISDENNEFTWLLTDDDKLIDRLDTVYFKVNDVIVECLPCGATIGCKLNGINIDQETIKYSYACNEIQRHLVCVAETNYVKKFKISYELQTIVEMDGNYFFIKLPWPAIGFNLRVDYSDSDVESMLIREFFDVPYEVRSSGRVLSFSTDPSAMIDHGKNLTVLYYR